MLNKTRIKCCVRAYTTYLDIDFLMMHPYILHKKICCLRIRQHMKIYYTTYDKYCTLYMTNITQHMKKIQQHMIHITQHITEN